MSDHYKKYKDTIVKYQKNNMDKLMASNRKYYNSNPEFRLRKLATMKAYRERKLVEAGKPRRVKSPSKKVKILKKQMTLINTFIRTHLLVTKIVTNIIMI